MGSTYGLSVGAQELSAEEQYKSQREARPASAIRPKLKMPQSVIVCRSKQCAPARLSMAKEYIFNTLLHMFDSNARQKALVCEGSANTHSCIEEFLTIPITVGVTPAYMYIDDVKIADVSLNQKNTMATNLLLNWGVTYNGQTPVCRPSKNLLYVKNVDNVIMEDNGYTCKMTTIGSTSVSTMFAIDYIDLDYGYIGGYYSIGLSGPAYGGGSGYMILRLPNDISIEAQDFEAKPIEPKIEETIEEIEVEVPDDSAAENKKGGLAIQAPSADYPTQGQFLYDANTGRYTPLKAVSADGDAQSQGEQTTGVQPVVPAVQQVPVNGAPIVPGQVNNASAEAFKYAATAHNSYGNYMAQPTAALPPQAPMVGQPPVAGQYIYDPQSGQYLPAPVPYQLDPVTGQYIPVNVPASPAAQPIREPQAPNVNTIIKYNHPAREYETAKAEAAAAAAAEAERQRLEEERRRKEEQRKKELEAMAVDFGGVKVYPIPSSNVDRTLVEPTLKNSLNEYNRENRRYE